MTQLADWIAVEAIRFISVYPKRKLFHSLVSCVLSQKISFNASRAIRAKLFTLLGTSDITAKSLCNVSPEQLYAIGINTNTVEIIRQLLLLHLQFDLDRDFTADEVNNILNHINNIPGIGPWTIKAVKIMTQSDNVFLFEDKYIRARMSEVFNCVLMSAAEAEKYSDKFIYNHDNVRYDVRIWVSYLFWCIKPAATQKLKNMIPLEADDLIL